MDVGGVESVNGISKNSKPPERRWARMLFPPVAAAAGEASIGIVWEQWTTLRQSGHHPLTELRLRASQEGWMRALTRGGGFEMMRGVSTTTALLCTYDLARRQQIPSLGAGILAAGMETLSGNGLNALKVRSILGTGSAKGSWGIDFTKNLASTPLYLIGSELMARSLRARGLSQDNSDFLGGMAGGFMAMTNAPLHLALTRQQSGQLQGSVWSFFRNLAKDSMAKHKKSGDGVIMAGLKTVGDIYGLSGWKYKVGRATVGGGILWGIKGFVTRLFDNSDGE